MADNPFGDLFDLNLEGRSPDEIEQLREYFERALERLSGATEYSQAVGDLCASWAWLDRSLDELFEPILDCPTDQVACIRNENTEVRTHTISRLFHTIPIPDDWQNWINEVLKRVRELARRRNRIVHDAWILDADTIKRIDKRALLRSPQAFKPQELQFDVEHEENAAKVEDTSLSVYTVTQAIRYAHGALSHWRSEGQFPPLDERWLPASKRTAQVRYLQSDPKDPKQQLFPVWNEDRA